MQKIICTVFGLFCGLGFCIAQQAGLSTSRNIPNLSPNKVEGTSASASSTTDDIDWENFDKYLELESEKGIFFFNEAKQLLFVDLEEIYEQFNYATDVQSIEVRATNNKVVFVDSDLHKLPSNVIYEIDLSAYPKDTYHIQVIQSHQAPLSYEVMKN